MRLRVLGCSGAEFPGHHPSAFLLDDSLLLDAGTIGVVLTEEEQWRIEDILVTHSHLDHIRGIPLIADNIVIKGLSNRVNVISTGEILAAMHTHLLNGLIWPDFTAIPSKDESALVFREIFTEQEFVVNGFNVTAYRVNHSVPAVGYRIAKGVTNLVYTGDTGPTERIWAMTGHLSALMVEVSFPNDMEGMARLTGHMTPSLLEKELTKLAVPPNRILVTHLKPQYYDRIKAELESLLPGIELLHEGDVLEL
jgi:ribonuclease BN (tRNA processing enzyme)